MDGKEIDYREKYERLGKTNEGEIVAVVSNSRGETHVLGESYLLKDYKKAATLVELLPGDEDLKHVMAISQEARTAIQSYKLRHTRSITRRSAEIRKTAQHPVRAPTKQR